MKRFKRMALSIATTFMVLALGTIQADNFIGRQNIIDLLSGNTVDAYLVKEGEQQGLTGKVRLKIKLNRDGSAEKRTYPADSRKSAFTEKGKWWVNKKSRLCFIWTQENKKRCGVLKQASTGKYVLYRKKQKVYLEKITPGP